MKRQIYLYILFAGFSLGLLISNLPYLNLVLTPEIIYLAFIVTLIISFKLPSQILPTVILVFVISLAFLLLFSQNKLADKFGEYLYFLLVVTFIFYILTYFKGNNK